MPRPAQREISAPVLLGRFVDYDRKMRRERQAITRAGFAKYLGKGQPTLHQYLIDANFPFPPVSPGDLVLLLDDAPPHELLWISDAWCELTGRTREELLYKPVTYLRESGVCDGPRDQHGALAAQLRAGARESGTTDAWICDAAHARIAVNLELRYGRRANAFYAHATRIDVLDGHAAEVFNVVPGIILRRKTADQVDLVELERLLESAMPRVK